MSILLPVAASVTALFTAAGFFARWHLNRPRLHVDDWTIHDRTEFPVRNVTTITQLHWGVNFTVRHSAGIPAHLLLVQVEVHSPLLAAENHRFDPVAPNRTVSPNTPYRSNVYIIDPRYTRNLPPRRPAALVVVTITYADSRPLSFGRRHTATFRGRYSVGDVDDGSWYIRAEPWDVDDQAQGPVQAQRPGAVLGLP